MTRFFLSFFFRIEVFSSRHEKVEAKSSQFDINKFLDEVATQDNEMLRKTVQISLKQEGWNSTHVAKGLLEKILTNIKNGKMYLRAAWLINNEVGGEGFKEMFSETAVTRFLQMSMQESFSKQAALAGFLNKLYLNGWLSGNSILKCFELLASDEFVSLEKVKVANDLIKPVVAKLQTDGFVDRFTFYYQLLRKRVNEDKSLEHREEYIELLKLLKSLSAVGEVTKTVEDKETIQDTEPSKLTTDEKNQIKSLIDDTTERNFVANLTVIAFFINKNLEKIDFLANRIVSKALSDKENIPLYVSMVKKLNELLISDGQSEQFCNYLLNASKRVLDNLLVEARISVSSFEWIPAFLGFSCELYKLKILGRDFIDSCLNMFFTNDRLCDKSVDCIVQIIKAVGKHLDEENPKLMEKYCIYFKYIAKSDSADTIRSREYKKLLELRNKEWKVFSFSILPEKTVLPDHKKLSIVSDAVSASIPHEAVSRPASTSHEAVSRPSASDPAEPVAPKIESIKNIKTLTLNFDEMCSDSNLSATVINIRDMLTSEKHVKTFIAATLNQPASIYQRDISIQAKLLRKLSESFSSDSKNQIDFGDILIEILNLEFTRTNAYRCFDYGAKLKFTRLLIMACMLFIEKLLSDDDFAPWLLHKHVNQIPVMILCDLVDMILPKIQNEGTKQLKLALSILEATIHTSMLEMSATIKLDIAEMAKELHFYRSRAINVPVSPAFVMPQPNWYLGQPMAYMRGGNKP